MKLRFPLFVALGVFASACGDDSSLKGVTAESVNLEKGGTGKASNCETTTESGAQGQTPKTGPDTTTATTRSTSSTGAPGNARTGVELPPPSPLCVGQANGTSCGFLMVCLHERCQPSVCGDGIVDVTAYEGCDDRNRESNDGCDLCVQEVCGDGVIQPGEECDDGNNIREDACDNACRRTASNKCGNGKLDPGEQCDDGNLENFKDACRNDCRLAPPPACGNGKVDNGEECDDGNQRENDGCGPNCKTETCGDGFVRALTEVCDDGNTQDGDGCSSKCKSELPACGNGILEEGETCDDGNNRNRDDCPNDCQLAQCGDTTIEGRETCDDGNTKSGDGCSDKCQRETKCGNGIVEALLGEEQCDDGNRNDFDRCPNDCMVPACGDNVHEGAWEECDGTDVPESGQVCDDQCRVKPLCGNGVVERSRYYPELEEACDDGNTVDDDGCSAKCKVEIQVTCGNGKIDEGEECDNGDNNSGKVDDKDDDKDDDKSGKKVERLRACHQCKWAFRTQKCSECMEAKGGRKLLDHVCPDVGNRPCTEVLRCFAKEQCAYLLRSFPHPVTGETKGPLSCACGDLSLSECQEAKADSPLPGPCFEVMWNNTYYADKEDKALPESRQKFFTNMANRRTPTGQAYSTYMTFIKCAKECRDYVPQK